MGQVWFVLETRKNDGRKNLGKEEGGIHTYETTGDFSFAGKVELASRRVDVPINGSTTLQVVGTIVVTESLNS